MLWRQEKARFACECALFAHGSGPIRKQHRAIFGEKDSLVRKTQRNEKKCLWAHVADAGTNIGMCRIAVSPGCRLRNRFMICPLKALGMRYNFYPRGV